MKRNKHSKHARLCLLNVLLLLLLLFICKLFLGQIIGEFVYIIKRRLLITRNNRTMQSNRMQANKEMRGRQSNQKYYKPEDISSVFFRNVIVNYSRNIAIQNLIKQTKNKKQKKRENRFLRFKVSSERQVLSF